jgi:hypothetical protein
MRDIKGAAQATGEILIGFLKSGPKSPDHLEETYANIGAIALSIIISAEEATARYELGCRDFLEKTKQVRGMPTRIISGGNDNQPDIVSSSGAHISEKFDAILPSLLDRFDWCVGNYRAQAESYLEDQFGQFRTLLRRFLEKVPIGGTKDKSIKSEISGVKKELRHLAEWNQLFHVYKATSFSAEVVYIFALEGNPIAAIWHYDRLDEQGEYRKTYDHKQRDDHVYAVRGNWAIVKGLMKPEPNGYIDEISRPHQELGCMCRLQWIYNLRDLPNMMMTEKGKAELERVRRLSAAMGI